MHGKLKTIKHSYYTLHGHRIKIYTKYLASLMTKYFFLNFCIGIALSNFVYPSPKTNTKATTKPKS